MLRRENLSELCHERYRLSEREEEKETTTEGEKKRGNRMENEKCVIYCERQIRINTKTEIQNLPKFTDSKKLPLYCVCIVPTRMVGQFWTLVI